MKKIVIANWKLNPATLKEANKIFKSVVPTATKLRNSELVICPSVIHLSEIKKSYRGKKIKFGAQDISVQTKGAHTGEISADQIKDAGGEYVIIGHSERRALGETDELISQKAQIALQHKLTPIICVGELSRSHDGKYLAFIEKQLKASLANIPKSRFTDLIIAYEPVWAIGGSAKEAMTAHDMHEMSLFIRKVLMQHWDKNVARKTRIIYGGSVKAQNIVELNREGNMNGFLVGSASLNEKEFTAIVKEVDSKI